MTQTNTIISIRKATIADLAIKKAIYTLVNNAYQREGKNAYTNYVAYMHNLSRSDVFFEILGGWTNENHIAGGERSSLEGIEASIKDQENTLLLAVEEDEGNSQVNVVGTAQIQLEGFEEASIGMLSVKQSYQSRGIGGRLLEAAMEELKRRGLKTAVLTVLESRSELVNWYTKIGFVETGERRPFPWTERLKVDNVGFTVLKKVIV
jgi:ribosomal protein S18 acetylase RimI-like enzyme